MADPNPSRSKIHLASGREQANQFAVFHQLMNVQYLSVARRTATAIATVQLH